MATLTGQTIATSYEQLLHVDNDGGGDTTNLVNVKDGDNGTTFGFTISSDALQMTSTNRLYFGDTGTYILQSSDGVLGLVSDTEIELNGSLIDINSSGALTIDAAGITMALGGDAGDDFIVDTTTLVVESDNNRVGIGTAAPASTLDVRGTVTLGVDDTGADLRVYSATASEGLFYDASEDEFGLLLTTKLKFHDIGGGEEMYASGDGVLLLNSATSLTITTPTLDLTSTTKVDFDSPILDTVTQGVTVECKQQADAFTFDGASDNILSIDASANRVGIGTAAPETTLHIEKSTTSYASRPIIRIQNTSTATNSYASLQIWGNNEATQFYATCDGIGGTAHLGTVTAHTMGFATNDTTRMTIHATSGLVNIVGALSKGSGSFKIDHPIPNMNDTHHLVHSFVESPKADLIYRGKVNLISGSASINIDIASGMTDGTFVLLCDDVQCFTTNESNWDKVKGSVSGNTLTIESENTDSTASISWMVIGDRKDEHIMDTEWTDENGKPIVEPLKENNNQ